MPLTILNIKVREIQMPDVYNSVRRSSQLPSASSFPQCPKDAMPHCLLFMAANSFLLKEGLSLSRHSTKTLSTSFILFSFPTFCPGKCPLFLMLSLYLQVKTSLILGDKPKKLHFVTHSYQGKQKNKYFTVKA